MKQSSGIYKSSVDNSIFVVFGGKIGLSLCHDDEHKLLRMHELKERINIGDVFDKSEIEKDCPPVSLVFDNVKSVDVVIKKLETIKELLIQEPICQELQNNKDGIVM